MSTRQFRLLLIASCFLCTCGNICVAERTPVPRANDVIIRTLEFREVDSGSEMDPFQAIRDFHVTRLEWTYIDFDARNRECVERVQAMGVLFGGAGSASLHGEIRHFPPQPLDMHMLDLDGKMVVQPHMRGWTDKRGIGDPSNPAFYEHHLNYYKKVVDWGAQLLHRDEPESPVFAAQRYGGGFSPSGIAGFRDWLRRNLSVEQRVMLGIEDTETFDYAEYLRERGAPAGDDFAAFDDPIKPHWVRYWADTTTAFWERFIAAIKTYAHPRVLSFSCNNSSLQMWQPYHRTFDYANSELMIETAHPVHLWERTQAALALGKVQVFGAPKTRAQPVSEAAKNALLRKVYATAYACGMLAKVPWDVFDQSRDGHARYFAKPEDMADLCAFVRAGDWQQYREIAAIGLDLPPTEPSVLRIEGGNGGVYAFWRESKTPDRPVLIHLVDWGLPKNPSPSVNRFFTTPSGERIRMYHASETIERTAAEPFRLVIPHAAWPTLSEVTFTLLRPAAYDATLHAKVQKLGDYARLVNRTLLTPTIKDTEIELELPPLTPWGILEITNETLEQPFTGRGRLKMGCEFGGRLPVIHFD